MSLAGYSAGLYYGGSAIRLAKPRGAMAGVASWRKFCVSNSCGISGKCNTGQSSRRRPAASWRLRRNWLLKRRRRKYVRRRRSRWPNQLKRRLSVQLRLAAAKHRMPAAVANRRPGFGWLAAEEGAAMAEAVPPEAALPVLADNLGGKTEANK